MFNNRVNVLTCKSINELTRLRINVFKNSPAAKVRFFFDTTGKYLILGIPPMAEKQYLCWRKNNGKQ